MKEWSLKYPTCSKSCRRFTGPESIANVNTTVASFLTFFPVSRIRALCCTVSSSVSLNTNPKVQNIQFTDRFCQHHFDFKTYSSTNSALNIITYFSLILDFCLLNYGILNKTSFKSDRMLKKVHYVYTKLSKK